jgi:hypothetical protein
MENQELKDGQIYWSLMIKSNLIQLFFFVDCQKKYSLTLTFRFYGLKFHWHAYEKFQHVYTKNKNTFFRKINNFFLYYLLFFQALYLKYVMFFIS